MDGKKMSETRMNYSTQCTHTGERERNQTYESKEKNEQ